MLPDILKGGIRKRRVRLDRRGENREPNGESYQGKSGEHGSSRHRLGTANAAGAGRERKRANFDVRSVLSTFILEACENERVGRKIG